MAAQKSSVFRYKIAQAEVIYVSHNEALRRPHPAQCWIQAAAAPFLGLDLPVLQGRAVQESHLAFAGLSGCSRPLSVTLQQLCCSFCEENQKSRDNCVATVAPAVFSQPYFHDYLLALLAFTSGYHGKTFNYQL